MVSERSSLLRSSYPSSFLPGRKAMKKSNPFRRQDPNASPSTRFATYRKPATGVLQERLQDILILELHKNGNKEYKTVTLRSLYASVMNVITQRPSHNEEKNNKEINANGQSDEYNDGVNIASPEITTKERNFVTAPESNKPNICQSSPDLIQHPPPPPPLPSSSDNNDSNISTSTRHERFYSISDNDNMIPPRRNGSKNQSPTTPNVTRSMAVPTYRERLGGYLHPRDMRRLVTPFSSSFNEPELMIRRHVMLLNFDPLRAIVLRDRVLVFVPNGADSMLTGLERRVFGGTMEMHQEVFGDPDWIVKNKSSEDQSYADSDYNFDDEWDDIKRQKWIDMAFELVSVDAVMQTVCNLMSEEALEQIKQAKDIMSILAGDVRTKIPIHISQERLRKRKDEIKEMEARVQGFVRAMNVVLDDDEDMALMNLSRLVTHPERFIQPVSEDVLHEESDEPELILEAYLQQAHSIVNALHLIEGKINSTEELLMMKLDTVRNRLLWINTVLSLVSISIASASLIGSLFGMNLINGFEESETMFIKVVVSTVIGSIGMLAALCYVFYRAGSVSVKFK